MITKRRILLFLGLILSLLITINIMPTLADSVEKSIHFNAVPKSSHKINPKSSSASFRFATPASGTLQQEEELMVVAEITLDSRASLNAIREMGYSCKDVGSCLLEIPKSELEAIQSAGFITKIHDQAIRVKPIDTTNSSPLAEVYQYGLNGTDYDIPDHNPDTSTCGWIWDTIEITGAPPGSVVTNVNYRIQVNHTFVGDLNIILFNLSPSAETVWDNWGSDEDSNFDDDPENDPDIYLDRWITSTFDGDLVNQDWSLEIMDCIYFDIGYIDYFELWIYYEESPPSCEVPVKPQLHQPSNGATLNQSRPNFDWGDAQDANEYWIVGTDLDDVYNYFFKTVTISEYTPDFDLSDGTYEWLVYSRNTANGCNESVVSDTWGFTIETPPPRPTLDDISNSDLDGDYTVSWSTVSKADSYELQEEFGGLNIWTTIYSGNSTSRNLADRTNGVWCYRVLASNAGGNSGWSDIRCTTVDTTLTPPMLNSISNADEDGNFTVSWSSVAGADGYELQEQYNSGSWSTIYTGSNTIQNLSGRADGSWCYRVRASNIGGSSGWSANQCTLVDTIDPPPIPTLYAISNADEDGNYTVSWSIVAGAESYDLQEQYYAGGWGTIYSGSSTGQNLTGRADGQWCYQVRASNAAGPSGWSNIQCIIVDTTGEPPPNPPNNLTAIAISQTQINISWQDNSTDESEFHIEQSPNGSTSWIQIGSEGANTTSYENTGLSCGTSYYYRVYSYRGSDSQSSEYSNTANATTTQCSEPPPPSWMDYLPLCMNSIEKFFEGPWEREDNDSISQANKPILSNKNYYGNHDDQDDFFGFYSTESEIIILDMNSDHNAVDKNGYPVIQTQLFYQSSDYMIDYKFGSSTHIEFNGQAGWYYVRITTVPDYVDESKQYSLNVNFP